MVDPAGPDVPLRTYQYSVACLKFTIPLSIELSRLKVARSVDASHRHPVAEWLARKFAYASGLSNTMIVPVEASGPLPSVMLIVPRSVPTATSNPVTATTSLVRLFILCPNSTGGHAILVFLLSGRCPQR